MESRCYETKKGEILQVFNLGFNRFGTSRQTRAGKWKTLKHSALPIRDTYEEAQADLDAFAAQMEYNPAMPPQENTSPPDPEAVPQPEEESTPVDGADEGDNPEGGASPPPETPVEKWDEDWDLSYEAKLRLHALDRRLEDACSDLIRVKGLKAAANSRFNGQIKEIEEEIEEVLSQMKSVRYDGRPPAQDVLPFGQESPQEPPQELAKDDKPQDESGDCDFCGHTVAAHFSPEHEPRQCAVSGCDCLASVVDAEKEAFA